MTLVVARRRDDRLVVVSDLRVTDEYDIRRGYPFGVLKAVTLSSDICVAFAGPVDAALDALRDIREMRVVDDVLPVLVRSSTGDTAPDFLVAAASPTRIARIRSGVVEDDLAVASIGDQAAREAFQALSAETVLAAAYPTEYLVQAEVTMPFSRLVMEGRAASVGEASIIIASQSDGRLWYQPQAVALMPPQSIPSGVATALRFGSAAEGGHAYSVLTPTSPGPGLLGLHFYQGHLGLLYHPLVERYPIAYPGHLHNEFRAAVLRDYKVDIEGLLIG